MYLRLRIVFVLLLPVLLFACEKPDPDFDGDGFHSEDCDDADPQIYPGADEVCYDGIDQDCTGGDRVDCDGDGFVALQAGGDDCDDQNSEVNPKALEVAYDGIDQDCDGGDLVDQDGDGCPRDDVEGDDCEGDDCNDLSNLVSPNTSEIPDDGIDQDCSGADLTDADEDGQSSEAAGGSDCDDEDSSVYLGAQEVAYDGIDQDCDGSDLVDVDGDGYVSELVFGGNDCNDEDIEIFPAADEIPYDGIDQDCDGADLVDFDQDGYSYLDDCDDANPSISPGATELTGNDVDEDCDGIAEDQDGDGFVSPEDCDDFAPEINPSASEISGNPVDEDCDGYASDQDGDQDETTELGGGDCDDLDPAVSSNALEVSNTIDDNCDGQIDESISTASASATIVGLPGGELGTDLALGDLDNDGYAELVIGAPGWANSSGIATGAVFVIPGGDSPFEGMKITSGLDVRVVYGLSDSDKFGASIDIGDVDGDGISDLLIGAPMAKSGEQRTGRIYVFPGGTLPALPYATAEEAAFSVAGRSEGDSFGAAVAAVGDVSGDLVGDFLVGAPEVQVGGLAGVGEAYLFVGKNVQPARDVEDAAALLSGAELEAYTGACVAGIGDVNDDGIDDIAVSAPGVEDGNGRVYVLFGNGDPGLWDLAEPDVLLLTEESGAGLEAVAGGLDINGDGLSDFVVGAPRPASGGRGKAYALFGRQDWDSQLVLSSRANGSFAAEQDGDLFASALAIGYADDDEYADIVVAAPNGNARSGAVYLFAGEPGTQWGSKNAASAMAVWRGASEGQAVTSALALDDMDESGRFSLVMSSLEYQDEEGGDGAIFVFQWN